MKQGEICGSVLVNLPIGAVLTELDSGLIVEVKGRLRSGGTKAEVARMPGVDRTTVYRMIDEGRLSA